MKRCDSWTKLGTVPHVRWDAEKEAFIRATDRGGEPIRLWCMLSTEHDGQHRHDEIEWS